MKKFVVFLVLLIPGWISNAQMVSNFVLSDINNTSQSFNDLKGSKLTVLDFWTTWCSPCMKSIPELNRIYQTYKDRGLEVIGINCDGPRSISKVGPVSNLLRITYPVLLDINSEVKNDLNLVSFPSLVITDFNGKVLVTHEGYIQGDEILIENEIKNLLNSIERTGTENDHADE